MLVEKENAAHNPLIEEMAVYIFALCVYVPRNNFIQVYTLWDSMVFLYGMF